MQIFAIIFVIVAITLLVKKGFKAALIWWLSPCVFLGLFIIYTNDVFGLISDLIGINIFGIAASVAWCAILKKYASKNVYIYLGIIPCLLFFGFFVVIPVIIDIFRL